MIDVKHDESAVAEEELEQLETSAASEAAPEESEEEEKKVSAATQRKFDKLTAARRSAERVARDLQSRLEAIEKKIEAKPEEEQKRVEASDPRPDINNWTGTAEEYTEALSRWAARQEHRDLSAKERKAAEQAERDEEARTVVQQFRERVDDFVEEHEDYNDVVAKIRMSTDVGAGVQNAIFEDDNGPALAYYLGQHPEIQEKMDAMSPAKAVAYLGRIAERLFPEDDETADEEDSDEESLVASTPRPKPAFQAPAPIIKPVRKSAPTVKPTSNGDELTTEQWLARELRREEKLRRR